MKKLITTCLLLTSITMVSFAQAKASKSGANGSAAASSTSKASASTKATTGPSAEQMAERHAKTIQAQYGLNADQYKNVYNADVDYYKQDQAARANGAQPGTGMTTQNNISRDQRYQNTMTPDQFAKYQSNNKVSK